MSKINLKKIERQIYKLSEKTGPQIKSSKRNLLVAKAAMAIKELRKHLKNSSLVSEIFTVEIIRINNIDETHFNFDYRILRNGVVMKDSNYSNKHNWKDLKAFENHLLSGEAVAIALSHI